MNLRSARMDDAPELARLHRISMDTAMPWLPKLHTPEEDLWWMETVVLPNQHVWVTEINGEIVGYAAVLGDMLEQLYILPTYHGQGIGSALLQKALELAESPMRLWAFQRNQAARGVYEHHGFEAIQFTDGAGNEEREPDVLYRQRR